MYVCIPDGLKIESKFMSDRRVNNSTYDKN